MTAMQERLRFAVTAALLAALAFFAWKSGRRVFEEGPQLEVTEEGGAVILSWLHVVEAPMAERLAAAFEEYGDRTDRFVIDLNSPGGAIAEGRLVIDAVERIKRTHRVSARRFMVLYNQEGFLVHTNYYLDNNIQAVEYEPEELINTRVRYFRASRLLAQTQQHTLETLQNIQRDHINYPNSICNHAEDDMDPLDREKTINAMIIDLTDRAMHIAWGNPCANPYHTYYLNA